MENYTFRKARDLQEVIEKCETTLVHLERISNEVIDTRVDTLQVTEDDQKIISQVSFLLTSVGSLVDQEHVLTLDFGQTSFDTFSTIVLALKSAVEARMKSAKEQFDLL